MIDLATVRGWVPRADPDGHKDTYGRVLVVGVSLRYSGAPLLAATAAARTGAGVVTLALPRSLALAVAGRVPELVYLPLDESAPGVVDASAARQIATGIADGRIRALVIGPGFASEPATDAFLSGVLARARVPAVIDGGALTILARDPAWPARVPEHAVLTPHEGEARRLAGAELGADRIGWATRHAAAWRCVIVLKGPCTVVASRDGRVFAHDRPNAALSTGGTGDALAGSIGALAAGGLGPFEAACVGVAVQGEAGALVAREVGSRGALAGDLIERLPRALATLRTEP